MNIQTPILRFMVRPRGVTAEVAGGVSTDGSSDGTTVSSGGGDIDVLSSAAASMASVGLVPGLLELLWWHAMREALPIKPANAAAGGRTFAVVRQKCLEVVPEYIPDTIPP